MEYFSECITSITYRLLVRFCSTIVNKSLGGKSNEPEISDVNVKWY